MELPRFNTAPDDEARPLLTECLAVPRWVTAVLGGRPYADVDALVNTAEAAEPLRADEIEAAIAAHPRIGAKTEKDNWSSGEQSGVDESEAALFRAANAEYETRFGHVYLVCASGRSGAELLADLRARLTNDPATELAVAGAELAKIAKLRLRKAVTA